VKILVCIREENSGVFFILKAERSNKIFLHALATGLKLAVVLQTTGK